MFPRQLSEQLFSLQDGGITPALSFWMHLSEDGSLLESGSSCSRINTKRLTYHTLDEILASNEPGNPDLHTIHEVGARLFYCCVH